ncbi:MAG: nickel-dependent hydrogenase large subunit, partial [Candidatus Norongarragalinales archaeon]
MTEIRIEKLSKIEGHARLVVTISKNEVKDVKLDVTEGARFFESLVRGHSCTEIPITAARICGFCSQAHQVTAINAVEDALGLSVSEQSLKLRELL